MIIDNNVLDTLQAEARQDKRLRRAMPFHKSYQSPCQRMLNALEPGTIIPIHRHTDKEETYVLLRGEVRVSFYDSHKVALESITLSETSDTRLLIIPQGTWHSVQAICPSVIFEVSDGPYIPLTDKDILQ